MFFSPSYSHGAFHGGTPQPPITANALGLVVFLVASQRWSGWRTTEFWIMLSYFCLFAVVQLMSHALTAMDENSIEALMWPTLALFVCTVGCALALPGLTIVRWLRGKLSNP